MNKQSKNILNSFLVLLSILLLSCEKDELEYVENNVNPQIYITGQSNGKIVLNANNTNVDKKAQTLTGIFGVNRSGIQGKEGFSVSVAVNDEDLPSGTVALAPSEYKIYTSGSNASTLNNITVPGGKTSAPIYLTISKTVLDAHPGKQLALKVSLSDPTKYQLNEQLAATTIIVDVPSFAERAVDVTRYIKNPGGNPPFTRSDDPTSRFGLLTDWAVNDAVKNIDNFTKGGFDSYNGGAYMSMERWFTPQISNGKIYQTITLPEGKYSFEADFESALISNEAYLAVAEGIGLPDVSDIASAIASSSYSTPKVPFQLSEQKEVSVGIVANLLNDFQGFRIRGVKLYKYESPFN